MKFDNNGNLFPYEAHTLSFDKFELVFGFDENRKFLLSKLLSFITELKSVLSDKLTIWVDGSFVTQRTDPKDIDIVIFVNFHYFESKKRELTALKESEEFVDLYYIKVLPEDHPNYYLTKFDTLDWLHFFTRDRKERRKGFIELKF
jgi:hypothetical protein